MLDDALLSHASRIGLSFEDSELTFGELSRRSSAVAALLHARGLRRGDRLAVYLSNSIEFIDLYLACVRLGIIFVPINILYRELETGHIIRDSEPSMIVSESPLAEVAVPWLSREEIGNAAAGGGSIAAAAIEESAPAAIVYTSGTTGRAKGAVLTRHNFLSNARNLIHAWEITSADRLLLPLPLFHVHGLGNGLHCWILSGCRMRLLPRFEHTKACEELLAERPTVLFGVPTVYIRLLELDGEPAAQIGRQLRLAVSGSAPLPVDTLERFSVLFGQTILERYGMTETLMTLSNPLHGERRAGTVGFPLGGVSIRIVSPEGEDVGTGETGQLLVKSETLFSGYWRNDDATRASYAGEWFRTGDLASCDSRGYVTLHGRMSDLIISSGYNIYPREIEELLVLFDGIEECAVVGFPDPLRGEVPVAFYVAASDLAEAELESWCRTRLASFKVPRRFLRVDSIPRTALGKPQKAQLKLDPRV